MKTVLVTGGAGFIGSRTILQLLISGNVRVVCVDNFDDTYDRSFKEQNVRQFSDNSSYVQYEADITDKDAINEIFEKEKPTHILHLAAKADTRDAILNPQTYIDTNITGSLNILEAAKTHNVENIVAASSSSVYGNNERVPWQESDQDLHPISPYGVTKYAFENLAYTYHLHFSLPITLLRYFNVYGENNRPGMVPYKWAEAMLTDKQIEISGDGERRRDYTYVGDTVRGTIAALWKPLGFEIINLGHGSPLSLNELLALFEKTTGEKAAFTSRASHPGSVEHTYADATKAYKLLGWKPKVSHEIGIQRLVDWFRENRLKKPQ